MALKTDSDPSSQECLTDFLDELCVNLKNLYDFRDLFFENHSLDLAKDKDKLVKKKQEELLNKFEAVDVDSQIPFEQRAKFLYMKGRCYNISIEYDPRAAQCLSKAVKLNPHMVAAWNELGECYWKSMNVKEAKASFEGALKHERNRISLRSLSIILRQECGSLQPKECTAAILQSVELAKEAVALDTRDGVGWAVLGNALLCQYFSVRQDANTLRSCTSAYKQAALDPVAKGQPDLHYNRGIANNYEERYEEALQSFAYASQLDPSWQPPRDELQKLVRYLRHTDDLVKTKGKIKTKKLLQMVKSIDTSCLEPVLLTPVRLCDLEEGENKGRVVCGKVVGSIRSENSVPFTFAMTDESLACVSVTVYNWAAGKGVIIGDAVCLPEPALASHARQGPPAAYAFRGVRVDDPTRLLVNGRRVARSQVASARATSTYEIH